MKYLKITALTLFLSIGFVFPSCEDIDCNCPDILGNFFDIQGINTENCCGPNANSGGLIDWEDYRLNLNFDVDYYGWEPEERTGFPNLSLMPSAYACSCAYDGYGGSEEKFEDLIIITKYDFDSLHLANDTISDIFNISMYSEPEDLQTFLANDTSFIMYEDFVLTLQQGPQMEGDFQLELIIKLDNGEEYRKETSKITLK